MTTGLTTKQWIALSEPWSPTTRAVALELLIWLWEHKTALPAVPKTLQRLSRVDDGRAFRQAWIALTLPAVGLFVEGSHGWTCPLQDAARGLQEARSRAGKVSAEVRRRAGKPHTDQRVEEVARRMEHPPWSDTPAPQPASAPTTAVPTLSEAIRKPHDFDEEHATSRDFLLDVVRTNIELDTVALCVAALVLYDGKPLTWEPFRDKAAALIGELYAGPTPPRVDRSDLTYRVWDDTFLGSYRDRFEVSRESIRAARSLEVPPEQL